MAGPSTAVPRTASLLFLLALAATELSAQALWRPIPSFRSYGSAAMAFDPDHGHIVRFGGRSPVGGGSDQTAVWDGLNWSVVTPTTAPPPRRDAMLAFDPVRRQIVVFGGRDVDGSVPYDDLWAFTGDDWERIPTPTAPGPRWGAKIVTDFGRNEVVLFGGYIGELGHPTPYVDAWAWNGSSWRRASPNAYPPPGTLSGELAFNPVSRAIEVPRCGGVSRWDGERWIAVSFTGQALPGGTGTFTDPLGRGILTVDARTRALWLGDGSSWTTIGTVPDTQSFPRPSITDPARGELLGLSIEPVPWAISRPVMRRWHAATDTWSTTPILEAPSASRAVHDAIGRRVLFPWSIGQDGSPVSTLQLDGHGMGIASGSGTPLGLEPYSPLAQDPVTGVILCASDSAVATGQRCWFDGRRWNVALEIDGRVPPYLITHVFSDPAGDRILAWAQPELWQWTFADGWRFVARASLPGARDVVYDSSRGRLVATNGTEPGSTEPLTTWEWSVDGQQQTTQVDPLPRSLIGTIVYAPALGGVVWIGEDPDDRSRFVAFVYETRRWRRLITFGTPPAAFPGLVGPTNVLYDPGRKRVIVTFGMLPNTPIAPGTATAPVWELLAVSAVASPTTVPTGDTSNVLIAFPDLGFHPFALALSGSTRDGIPLRASPYLGQELLPLDPDPLFFASLSIPIVGSLDLFGRAAVPVVIPGDPALRGLRFFGAAAVLDPAGGFSGVSNEVALRIAR